MRMSSHVYFIPNTHSKNLVPNIILSYSYQDRNRDTDSHTHITCSPSYPTGIPFRKSDTVLRQISRRNVFAEEILNEVNTEMKPPFATDHKTTVIQ